VDAALAHYASVGASRSTDLDDNLGAAGIGRV